MGGIAKAFGEYVAKWPHPQSIQSNAATFVSEAKSIFQALSKRIQREDEVLYPTADAA